MTNHKSAVLHDLINLLPDPGSPWDRDHRDRFLRAFEAALDFVLPCEMPEYLSRVLDQHETLTGGWAMKADGWHTQAPATAWNTSKDLLTPREAIERFDAQIFGLPVVKNPDLKTPEITVKPAKKPAPIPMPNADQVGTNAARIIAAACTAFGVDPSEIRGPSKDSTIHYARKAAALLLTELLGWNKTQVGEAINRHMSLVANYLAAAAEWEKFDRPSFDRLEMARQALTSKVAA